MREEFDPKLSFEIRNSQNFFEKLLQEYSDFDKDSLSSRFALNCALNSWHLSDWIFQEYYAKDPSFQDSIEKTKSGNPKETGLLKFQKYLIGRCEELDLIRLVANGSKHCILNKVSSKSTDIKVGDFNNRDWNRFDWKVSKLILKLDDETEVNFESVLLKTIEFWRTFIHETQQRFP